MEATSASVSEASLYDAQSQLYINNVRTNGDTPLPTNKLSDETLRYLVYHLLNILRRLSLCEKPLKMMQTFRRRHT